MITTPEQMREAAMNAVEDYCSDMPDLAGHGHSVGLKDAIRAIPIAPQPVAVTPVETFVMRETVVDAISYERKTVEHLAVKYADYLNALTIQPADPLSDPRVKALVEACKTADTIARDLGWHRIYDATDAALRAIGGEA